MLFLKSMEVFSCLMRIRKMLFRNKFISSIINKIRKKEKKFHSILMIIVRKNFRFICLLEIIANSKKKFRNFKVRNLMIANLIKVNIICLPEKRIWR